MHPLSRAACEPGKWFMALHHIHLARYRHIKLPSFVGLQVVVLSSKGLSLVAFDVARHGAFALEMSH